MKKPITLIKGSNVGYDLTEIKNVPTPDLKNILNLIYSYFTKRSRQKTKNSNFRDLYLRVKKELKEREAPIFKPEPLPVYHPPEKPTSIYEVYIPEFFNDKKFINNSDILKIINEEEKLREEIENLKKEKMALMCEMINKNNCNSGNVTNIINNNNNYNFNNYNFNLNDYNYNLNNYNFNLNYKNNEENKEDDRNLNNEKIKEININNNNNSNICNNNNFNIDIGYKINEQMYEENPFINPMKYPLDIKLEQDKIFQDENYFLQKF